MAGAARTFQHAADSGDMHIRGQRHTERVHRFHFRQPQHIAASRMQAAGIGVGRAWIAGKIFVGAKLGGIDEHAGHHFVHMLPRQCNQ